jgi:hypothetical protein
MYWLLISLLIINILICFYIIIKKILDVSKEEPNYNRNDELLEVVIKELKDINNKFDLIINRNIKKDTPVIRKRSPLNLDSSE